MRTLIVAVLVLSAVAIPAFIVLRSGGDAPIRASLAVAEAMQSDTAGYARADAVRPFVFPEDYGPHPDFKTEWWYFTGNLKTAAGRRFGYEFTIFRFALAPSDSLREARRSDWASRQLYMGHVGLTDVETGRFVAFERFSRGGAGLAGAQVVPYRVWLEDWTMEGDGDAFPMRLQAMQDGAGFALTLAPEKPVVLQGEDGWDRKGPEPGNASYYYSFTRLATEGTVTLGDRVYPVEGLSWKDHEWSTSALGAELVGWDWFALQLDDGWDLMYYQLRRRDGTPSPYTTGTLVAPDGRTYAVSPEDITLDVRDTWVSPRGGEYPSAWHLRIPEEGLDLTITPYVADQELDATVRYWEGAVRVEGTAGGRPVSGSGYVELTGYADGEGTEGRERSGRAFGS